MSNQKFYADPNQSFKFPNGAMGYRPTGTLDTLGPYAKVVNCPVEGTKLRLTCYATGHADTMSTVPACTQHKQRFVSGFFYLNDEGTAFVVSRAHRERVGLTLAESVKATTPESSQPQGF